MKRLNLLTLGVAALFSAAIMFNSCAEDPDPVTPTLQFIAEVDGYDVTITAEATDAETWAWDYGDGTTSTTAGSHTYSYEDAGSGDYVISCTVTSKDDLTAVKTVNVTIAASLEEIIAGVGDDGKTWILTQVESSFSGKIGAGGVTNDMALYPDMSLIPDDVLGIHGLGDEYTDEFTFYRDGTLAVDMKNGRSLVGIVYGNIFSPGDIIPSNNWGTLPLASIPGTNIDDATWSLSYEDRTVTWYDEFVDSTLVETTFTFPEDDENKICELVLSEGAYVCFNDLYYPDPVATILQLPGGPQDNSIYILKEVTGDMMNIAVGLNSWQDYPHLPSLLIHLVLIPK
jgi:PKD repeat protein